MALEIQTPLNFSAISIKELPQLHPEHKTVVDIYRRSYQEKWLGEAVYQDTVANTSTIVRLKEGDNLVAAANLNDDRRIMVIAVGEDYRGKNIGTRFLREVAEAYPKAGISIDIHAKPMLISALQKDSGFVPVDDPYQIENFFKGLKGVGENYFIEHFYDEVDFGAKIAERYKIIRNIFTTFYRFGSIHKPNYHQVLFVNGL